MAHKPYAAKSRNARSFPLVPLALIRHRPLPEVVNRLLLQELGGVNDLAGVRREMEQLVQDDLRVRRGLPGAVGYVHQPRWVERVERPIGFRNRLVEPTQELVAGNLLTFRKLRRAITNVLDPADRMGKIESGRPAEVQD